MFPENFEYVSPASVSEAAQFLEAHPEDAKILAGGQSLIPILKLRLAAPQFVVDIGRIQELKAIREDNGNLEIGSLVRHVEIERSPLVAEHCPLLAETAAEIGAENFFIDIMTSALEPNEILTAIRVPKAGPRTGTAYLKMHQQASGFAIVGVASIVMLDVEGKVSDARVTITGIDSAPYRAKQVEDALLGTAATAKDIAAASAFAARGIEPLSDIHASSEYRAELAAVFTRRSLEKSARRAARK